MFRKTMLFSLIMVLFYSTAVFGATSITFTFANGQITGTDPTYYEFDVMAAAGTSGTRIGDSMAYINYNTAGFGSSVKVNSKITVTAGTLTQGGLYSLQVNDNNPSRVAITAVYAQPLQPDSANELPTTPTQWVHVKIEIADTSKAAGLSFEQSSMTDNEYKSDNSTKYSPVSAVDTDDTSLPVELSSFTAIDSIDGVNLEWTTQTEINNVGFYIHRSETKEGEYVRVNEKIIKGAGNSDMLHTYSYTDEGVSPYVNTYFYYLEDVDIAGIKAKSQIIKVTRQKVKVKIIPDSFALFQNYPNPYNPETWIPYRLPVDTTVTIKIYDVTGRVVRTFSLGEKEAGVYTSRKEATYWNGRNEAGERVNSGLYFYAIEAGNFKAIKRMLLVK